MPSFRTETDSLGEVQVPSDRLWGAQTQRSLQHFSIGTDLMPRELIPAYAVVKKAAAVVNRAVGLLPDLQADLIVLVCDEILTGRFDDQFPLHVWMTGSGTQFNMNVNEVISNRACQLSGTALGSKTPVHPNDHVNLSQSSNDTFPSAMCIATAQAATSRLVPEVSALAEALARRSEEWNGIVKVGRTHLQDATPLTLGQEICAYSVLLEDDLARIEAALGGVYQLALGGTAVGTGINAPPDFDKATVAEIARLTGLPFTSAPDKFAVMGSHDALVHFSGALRTLACSLFKIANDIRLLACGPRCGIAELRLPENEPGSSIMPGKVNPTQCEALTMVALQVMANDTAVGSGGAGGILEMNVYKPLIIYNVLHSIRLLADASRAFCEFLVEGMEPDRPRIAWYMERTLMLATALTPAIGYDQASRVAHHAMQHDLTLRDAALQLGVIEAEEFDRLIKVAASPHR